MFKLSSSELSGKCNKNTYLYYFKGCVLMNKVLKKLMDLKMTSKKLNSDHIKRPFLLNILSKISVKNITIIRGFVTIWILSLLSVLVIGISSFVTINSTQKNLKLMYTSVLERTIKLNSINMNINKLRTSVIYHLTSPTISSKSDIENAIEGISNDITIYKTLQFSKEDGGFNNFIDESFKSFKPNLEDIMKITNDTLGNSYNGILKSKLTQTRVVFQMPFP